MLKKILRKIKKNFMSDEEVLRRKGVKIGEGCYISTTQVPNEGYLIEIGNYVRIASGTSFYTHGGLWSIRHWKNDPDVEQFGKIKIGDYTSIGSNCMIMPGVIIGNGCVVAGGSVVTKSVPDGCMVAGNPAKFIGYTEDFYKRVKEKNDFGCKKMNAKQKKEFLLSQQEDKFIKKGFIKLPN